MADEEDISLPFEVVKIAMSQTKDGVKLVLVIHPHDNASDVAELFGHPVGTRYMAALVKLQEDETPEPRLVKTAGQRAVEDAGKLCRNELFQQWLFTQGSTIAPTEADAVNYVIHYCGVKSRREIATNEVALKSFDSLRLRFMKEVPYDQA